MLFFARKDAEPLSLTLILFVNISQWEKILKLKKLIHKKLTTIHFALLRLCVKKN